MPRPTGPARSPCATAGLFTPSASAEPTPEPASPSWSKTLDIRIIDAATGELLRELVLDTTQRNQGTGRPPRPTRSRLHELDLPVLATSGVRDRASRR